MLDWGVLEQREAAALAAPHATLGEVARRRAVQLFSHGEGVAYGAAFSAAFAPAGVVATGGRLRRSDAQLNGNSRKSRATPRPRSTVGGDTTAASIGMHLRHQSTSDTGLDLRGPAACLRQLSLRQPRCTVLLAADRNATIEHAPAAFGRLCSVVSAARGTRGASSPTSSRGEHGPWAGAAVVQDMELLARSTQAFIGTHDSTLSFLMFAHAAFRLAEQYPQGRRLRYHTLPGCTEQPAFSPPNPWPCQAACAATRSLDVQKPHRGVRARKPHTPR